MAGALTLGLAVGCGSSEEGLLSSTIPKPSPSARATVDIDTNSSPLFVRVASLSPGSEPFLIASDRAGNALQIVTQSAGTWSLKEVIALPESPGEVVAMDVDGDAFAELLVAYRSSFTVGVWRRGPDGIWSESRRLPVGSAPQSLRLADFDGDSVLDLAVGNVVGDSLSIFFGRSGGGFEDPLALASGTRPVQIDTGDFNHDGLPDLASSNFVDSTVQVWFSSRERAFVSGPTLVTGAQPFGLESLDLDGDGQDDLVVANEGDGTLSAFRFQNGLAEAPQTTTVGAKPDQILAADVDGDGRVELLVTLEEEQGVAVIRNGGGELSRSDFIPTRGGPVGIDCGPSFAVTANFFGSGLTLIPLSASGGAPPERFNFRQILSRTRRSTRL